MLKLRKKAPKQPKMLKPELVERDAAPSKPAASKAAQARRLKDTRVKVPAQAVSAARMAEVGDGLPGMQTTARG